MARDDDFDLPILDIGLPGQHGFAVLRTIRARAEKLSVLTLTARDDVVDTVTGLHSGADDHVTKPLVFEELLTMFGTVLAEEHHTAKLLERFRERVVQSRRRMLGSILEKRPGTR
jgi:DNA-binding response OmpR family regulator